MVILYYYNIGGQTWIIFCSINFRLDNILIESYDIAYKMYKNNILFKSINYQTKFQWLNISPNLHKIINIQQKYIYIKNYITNRHKIIINSRYKFIIYTNFNIQVASEYKYRIYYMNKYYIYIYKYNINKKIKNLKCALNYYFYRLF